MPKTEKIFRGKKGYVIINKRKYPLKGWIFIIRQNQMIKPKRLGIDDPNVDEYIKTTKEGYGIFRCFRRKGSLEQAEFRLEGKKQTISGKAWLTWVWWDKNKKHPSEIEFVLNGKPIFKRF